MDKHFLTEPENLRMLATLLDHLTTLKTPPTADFLEMLRSKVADALPFFRDGQSGALSISAAEHLIGEAARAYDSGLIMCATTNTRRAASFLRSAAAKVER